MVGFTMSLRETHCLQFISFITQQHHSVCTMLQYDFIIVGGGTSGSIIASRLARCNATPPSSSSLPLSVVVLEAGSDDRSTVHASSIAQPTCSANLQRTDIDWHYSATHFAEQEACQASFEPTPTAPRSMIWPRGKVYEGLNHQHNIHYTMIRLMIRI
jgi:choline dehydrogenase-like flavoprotein